MFAGKEIRVLLKGQAKESYLELKKRDDKDSVKLVNSIQRIIDILKSAYSTGVFTSGLQRINKLRNKQGPRKPTERSEHATVSIDRWCRFSFDENPQFGNPIEKRKIPKEYIKQGIRNLYRCELSNYWRLIYTIEGTRVEIFTFVLNIMDHKKYNKLFGYRKN